VAVYAQIDAGDANNYREYGQPVERSTRIAVVTVGQVMWELIEPLDEEGIYARFSLLRKVRAYITSPSPHRTSMRDCCVG
jgi:hypothetical protein